MNEKLASCYFSVTKHFAEVSKVYFCHGVKGCRYIVISSHERQMCLLIDFGY